MSTTSRPPCPGCGGAMIWFREALCPGCWREVPVSHRAKIRAAQREIARRPTSPASREGLDIAIAAAMGARQ